LVRTESVGAAMSEIKWSRAVLAGLAVNLASFVVGGGGYVLFDWTFRLEPTFIWRWTPDKMSNMSVCWWTYLIVGNTLLALFLSITFALLYNGIPGRGVIKGLVFGAIVWLIGVLPAAFTIHVLTVMNAGSVLYFTTQAIIEHLIYGTIIAVVYGNPLLEVT
jgi:hypothetical protein